VKVSDAHLEQMREKIRSTGLDNDSNRAIYRDRRIPRGDAVRDIDRRYRWDLYWAAARLTGGMPGSEEGYDDAHVDTALRSIVAPLEERP
jgi:hypothetical protein